MSDRYVGRRDLDVATLNKMCVAFEPAPPRHVIYQTRYIGIFIEETNNQGKVSYWITDNNGGSLYFGSERPNDASVDMYRNCLLS